MPKIDEEKIILKPSAPLVPILYNGAGWTGANRCSRSSYRFTSVPIPSDYIVPSDAENDSATYLLADNRSIVQSQPLARCTAGGYATSLVVWNPIDIYGDGIPGAHGGSNLSAFGGSLRVGEMRPGGQAPHHALKVIVDATVSLYKCTTSAQCYRWPASNHREPSARRRSLDVAPDRGAPRYADRAAADLGFLDTPALFDHRHLPIDK